MVSSTADSLASACLPASVNARGASRGPIAGEPQRATGTADAIELSDAARRTIEEPNGSGVRDGLVSRVRGEIAAGNYLTDEKLDAVVARLHSDLFGE